jgi:signal transduction histidine kinase/ActR/RegA family two-component response regulator
MNDSRSALERLFVVTASSRGVDELLLRTIELLVDVAGMDVGVIRVDDRVELRSRASVGLDDEVRGGFTCPTESVEVRHAGALRRLSMDDPRVSDVMRGAGIQAAYWLALPHDTLSMAACFGSRENRDIALERVRVLEALARPAGSAIERFLAHQALEEKLRERDRALADIAHDLKNSINAVALSTTVLDQRLEAGSSLRSTVDRIARNTRRAARVVESLLSTSLIEAGKLVLQQEALEPAELVLYTIELYQDAGVGAGIVLASDLTPGLPLVRADRERLQEVFDNLVGNALKYTKTGGAITVGAAPRDDHVVFWVKDTGAGIPPEELPRVFDRYWRAKPGDGKGTGLGLGICRGILDAHGGRIWAESTPGHGTTILFTVPAVETRQPAGSVEVPNVLLVDDRPENLQALEAILDGQSYRTLTASSGKQALHIALQEELSLVLLDVEMPEMDGFETATHLKLVKRTKSIPIVFVTAHGEDPERVYQAYAAGGADYLVKPLDPEIVRRKVAVFTELGRRRIRSVST